MFELNLVPAFYSDVETVINDEHEIGNMLLFFLLPFGKCTIIRVLEHRLMHTHSHAAVLLLPSGKCTIPRVLEHRLMHTHSHAAVLLLPSGKCTIPRMLVHRLMHTHSHAAVLFVTL